ncbi:MAG: REP element-mobilizing transposase RayT, partial [Flavobacteriales bacterium]
MAVARKRQVSLIDTPYYHCISRCVRRAFLCGEDNATGRSFEHRRAWVEDKLLFLSKVFAIDVCAYAVMSNHSHLVLYVDEQQAKSWSTLDVIHRWHQLFKGTLLTQQYARGDELIEPLQAMVEQTANVYRQRLTDISWFMRILNEGIARKANSEDNCTGCFWESRFKSQALLDDAAIIACMAYVDLNPVRAKMAVTPETSTYTSIQRRIKAAIQGKQPSNLLTFVGNEHKNKTKGLNFELNEYIELIEVTGRCIRADKSGYIEEKQPQILTRLNISPKNWLILTTKFTKSFHGAVGHADVLDEFCQHQALNRRTTLSA